MSKISKGSLKHAEEAKDVYSFTKLIDSKSRNIENMNANELAINDNDQFDAEIAKEVKYSLLEGMRYFKETCISKIDTQETEYMIISFTDNNVCREIASSAGKLLFGEAFPQLSREKFNEFKTPELKVGLFETGRERTAMFSFEKVVADGRSPKFVAFAIIPKSYLED